MALQPIVLARLVADVRQSFATAISIDISLTPEASEKYNEDVQKEVAESINNIAKGLDTLIGILSTLDPPQTAETNNPDEPKTPVEEVVTPVEQSAEQNTQ